MNNEITRLLNELDKELGQNPVNDWERGRADALSKCMASLKAIQDKVIDIEDIKELLEQVYNEKQGQYQSTDMWTNMYTAYLNIAGNFKHSMGKKLDELAAVSGPKVQSAENTSKPDRIIDVYIGDRIERAMKELNRAQIPYEQHRITHLLIGRGYVNTAIKVLEAIGIRAEVVAE